MPSFSSRSHARLATCDRLLYRICEEAIKEFDFSVLCGRRGKDEQSDAVERGASKVLWPNSAHNCALPDGITEDPDGLSLAIDIAPYPINWDDLNRFVALKEHIFKTATLFNYEFARRKLVLRWGGDWDGDGQWRDERFVDMPHYELRSFA